MYVSNLQNKSIYSRVVGAYQGLAIGDAFGATTEFMTPGEIKGKHGTLRNIEGGGWLRLPKGMVTDDTTMSLTLGESILEFGGFDAVNIAEAFSEWMRKKPVDIGNTVRRGIVHFRYSGIAQKAENEQDAGNGAVMRCLPVIISTLGANWPEVERALYLQAHITHNNVLSDAALRCVAHAIRCAVDGYDKSEILSGPVEELITRYPLFSFRTRRWDNPTGYIIDTMRVVLQGFFDTDTFEDCLIDVVNRGGDADTTGAIVGMLAGSYYGTENIPSRWIKALDQKTRIACEKQALDLLEFSRSQYAGKHSNRALREGASTLTP